MGKDNGEQAVKKKKKKKSKASASPESESKTNDAEKPAKEKPERKPFSRPDLFTKAKDLQILFQAFRDGEVSAAILRPRMQTESVEHGRGAGIVRNFGFRKFKEVPKAVVYMNVPSSKGGGAFEPTDRLLTAGEQVRLTYTTTVEGADGPIFFLAKGFFLRKSFYIPEDPQNPGKPWTGPRDEAEKKFSKDVMVRGDDVIEVRIDAVNSFPGGPGRTDRAVLERYLSAATLFVFPGGGGWNQKSTQGIFFDAIRDPLDKVIEREDVKVIDKVTIDEFGNLGDVTLLIKERLLADVEHEVARPSVVKNPEKHVSEINMKLGFLLRCKVDDDIGESLMRTFPKKAGKAEDIYLPLILENVANAREQFRVTFQVFPRDLIEERSRTSMERGLKFMPPYALHQGSENQNTYSKLLILLNQRFREDEKPEEDKLKSEKLQASVEKRIADRRSAFTDDKVKSAFTDRVSAKKRKEEG